MCLAKKSTLCFMLLLLAAAGFMAMAQAPSASITFMEYDHSPPPTIMNDPDVKYILNSSIFTDVSESVSHSAERHASDQDLKNKCLNGDGNPVLGMINPDTKHCVEVISSTAEEEGHRVERFLVRVVKQIDGAYHEITAFTDEWSDLYAVEKYLNEVGYMQIWP